MRRSLNVRADLLHLLAPILFAAWGSATIGYAIEPVASSSPSSVDGEIRIALSGYTMPADRLVPSARGHAHAVTDGYFKLRAVAEPSCNWIFTSPRDSSTRLVDPPATASVSWTLEGRLLSLEGDTATIDLRWAREVKMQSVSPRDSLERRAKLVLREGETRPIDLISILPEASDNCGWFVVELGFQFVDPPEVADAELDYEVWLIQREPNGDQFTERALVSGRQGAKVDYRFSLFHGLDGTLLSAEHNDTVQTTISGEIKGRARPDGLIDLAVEANRSVAIEGAKLGVGSGIKRLTVRPSETIEVVLPPAGGTLRIRDARVLDLAEIFAGHTTAIRITATRVR